MGGGTPLKKALLDSVPHVPTVFSRSLSPEPLDPVFMRCLWSSREGLSSRQVDADGTETLKG